MLDWADALGTHKESVPPKPDVRKRKKGL
jgi:hypothetical protein